MQSLDLELLFGCSLGSGWLSGWLLRTFQFSEKCLKGFFFTFCIKLETD